MMIWFAIMWGVLSVTWMALLSIRVPQTRLSQFERSRRSAAGDARADYLTEREHARERLLVVQRVGGAVLFLGAGLNAVAAYGPFGGGAAVVATLLLYEVCMALPGVRRLIFTAWHRHERRIVSLLHGLRWLPAESQQARSEVRSRQELAHIIETLPHAILEDHERRLLQGELLFSRATVGQEMVSIDLLLMIDEKELLGPLVLDQIHKSGQSVVPVTSGRDETVVGVLPVKDQLSVQRQQTPRARDAMLPLGGGGETALYADDTLASALEWMVKQEQFIAPVYDRERDIVGVIDLRTIIQVLFQETIQ